MYIYSLLFRLCFKATRGLSEKNSEDTKMLLLQLRCSLCLCNWLWWPGGAQRNLCPAAVCATSWAVFKAGPLAHAWRTWILILFLENSGCFLAMKGCIYCYSWVAFFSLSSVAFALKQLFIFSKKWARVIFSAISCSPHPDIVFMVIPWPHWHGRGFLPPHVLNGYL